MPRAASAVSLARTAVAGSASMKSLQPRIKHTILNRVRTTDTTVFPKISGTGSGAADTTAPLWPGQTSHVRLTGHGTTGAYFGITLSTPWDLTTSYVRVAARVNNYTFGKTLQLGLATSQAQFTAGNYIRYQSKSAPASGSLANWWANGAFNWDSCPPSLMTKLGTGVADLTKVGFVVVLVADQSTSNSTVWDIAELQQVQLAANARPKCVIWHDDSVTTGGQAIHDKMKVYGWGASEATEWETITSQTSGFPVNAFRADGWSFASHATTNAEHGDVDAASVQSQAYRNRLQGMKFFPNQGQESDFTYWGGLKLAIAYDVVKLYYRSGRWNTSGNVYPDMQPPADPHIMKAILVAASETFATNWQPLIDNAILSNGIAQFVFHQDVQSNSSVATQFDAMLTYLDSKRAQIDVVTLPVALAASVA